MPGNTQISATATTIKKKMGKVTLASQPMLRRVRGLGSRGLAGLGSGLARDWGQILLVAIGKQHSPRAKPHSESRQASGKT